MEPQDFKKMVWEILPRMSDALRNVLSVSPMYNARLSKTMGIHPVHKNRGNGNFFLWTLLRDERTAGELLGVGAIDANRENKPIHSGRNIIVNEDKHNPLVENYEDEVIKKSWEQIQTLTGDLCEILKSYVKTFPSKAYGGSFIREMDINLCEYSASGEFVDYLIKILLHQGVLEYTGETGPRGSYLLRVAKDIPYEVQPQIDPSKFRSGISAGEALASVTFLDFMPELHIVHQKKWKECRDKKELPFDFYDEENGIVVEVDGAQHFYPVDYFGGEKSYEYVKNHDRLKNQFVVDSGMKIIRIDSSTRDVRSCLRSAYADLESLPAVSLYGNSYGVRYTDERVPADVVINYDTFPS